MVWEVVGSAGFIQEGANIWLPEVQKVHVDSLIRTTCQAGKSLARADQDSATRWPCAM